MILSQKECVGLLLSGGLDSGILLGHLLHAGHHVQPIYVRTGLAWEPDEHRALLRFLEALRHGNANGDGWLAPLVELDQPVGDLYGWHWSTGGAPGPAADAPDEAVFLPGRNALLLLKPLLWCAQQGIDELALGVLAMNPFADATDAFFDHFTAAVNAGGGQPVRVSRPLAHLSKASVMRLGRRLPLELTFSCINPIDGRHCGVCNKCTERNAAFRSIDLPDPTNYVHPDAVEINDHRQPV